MEWRRLIQGSVNNASRCPARPLTAAISAPLTINVPGAAQVAARLFLPRTAPAVCCQLASSRAQPFPGNTIPTCMIDPNATALLNAGIFPAPTSGNKFFGRHNAPTNLKEEVVRIDHNFTSKFSVFGHFIAEQVTQGFAISQWSGANVPTVGDTFGNPSYSAVVHTTYTISPTC